MVALTINGQSHNIDVDPTTPLLWVIREQVGLTGTKYGCGIAQCGACTVHVDGVAMRSCGVTVSEAAGKDITTIEGLGTSERPHPLQRAFIAEQALQCGYCVSGILMSAAALLRRNPSPTSREVKEALDRNLCRCGSHNRMVRAVLRAAEEMAAG